jgi:YebC/PmpR family DNA-binding regulatory protein
MAGHSKWSTIKHQKAITDQRRGKLFSKLARDIAVLAKSNPDPQFNPSLKVAIDKAKKAGMPKTNIENAVSGKSADSVREYIYEGYGINGVKLIIEAATDNNNRAVAEVRSVLNKFGGSLGTSNSVLFDFVKVGEIVFEKAGSDSEIEGFLIELDIDEYEIGEKVYVQTKFESFRAVEQQIAEAGYSIDSSEITYKPLTFTEFDDQTVQKNLNIIERLEELDDVSTVYSSLQ